MFKKLCLLVAILSAIILIATVPAYNSFAGNAKMIQRVQKNSSDALFGEEGTPVGEPTLTIIEDPKAFIGEPADGVYKVDQGYLDQNKIYPTQLKTVQFWIESIRLGAGVAGLLGVVLGLWKRKPKAA
jgi:hypothetical protein